MWSFERLTGELCTLAKMGLLLYQRASPGMRLKAFLPTFGKSCLKSLGHHSWLRGLNTPANYLEVSGYDGFSIVLNLSELAPQALHLALHLHHILEVPLSSKVEHLNGLRHVLHLHSNKNLKRIYSKDAVAVPSLVPLMESSSNGFLWRVPLCAWIQAKICLCWESGRV